MLTMKEVEKEIDKMKLLNEEVVKASKKVTKNVIKVFSVIFIILMILGLLTLGSIILTSIIALFFL